MNAHVYVAGAKVVVDLAAFALSRMTTAVMSLYGVAAKLDTFVDEHINEMKASTDSSVERAGRVLEGVKRGLFLGYAGVVVLMATGQLLLGNPLTAIVTVAKSAVLMNPVASTCAAIGAIWFGWKALSKNEQQAILKKLSDGFSLAIEAVEQVIDFALGLLKSVFDSAGFVKLKSFVANSASHFGRSIYAVTGRLKDLAYSSALKREGSQQLLTSPLSKVLEAMDRESELEPLLTQALRVDRKVLTGMDREGLERLADRELSLAARYSLPGASLPSYDDIVRIIAHQMKLPTRAELTTSELERVILFKVMERSLERMTDDQKQALTKEVEQDLRLRGIAKKVSFAELVKFVKFTGMDVGGTFGTLALTAPGIAGIAGLNALQFIVLKGIILSSGYMAAGGALLGIGMGGAMLAIAGSAGPIGAALTLLYAGYSLSGPAYRKLIPAVCIIGAKRLEMSTETSPLMANRDFEVTTTNPSVISPL